MWNARLESVAGGGERGQSGTVVATGTFRVTGGYHPQITTKTRLSLVGTSRTMNVLAIADEREKHRELDLVCAEVVA